MSAPPWRVPAGSDATSTPVALRFDLLDGMRGVAAIGVMIFHMAQHSGLSWIPGAWVAVDLFFVLSGFVIAHSYGEKILAGMSGRAFMAQRIMRLGPMYAVGLVLGLIAALIRFDGRGMGYTSASDAVHAFALGTIFLPDFRALAWPLGPDVVVGAVFPLNDPAWSLFFELVVNALFFWCVSRYRQTVRASWTAAALALNLAVTLACQKINPGWGAANFAGGFPRVLAEFALGAWMFRSGAHLRAGHPAVASALVACMCFMTASSSKSLALLSSLTLVPLSVALLTAIPVATRGVRVICRWLGDLSYPLYIVHIPIYRLLWQTLPLRSMDPPWQVLTASMICVGLAVIFVRLDRRWRTVLAEKLHGQLSILPNRMNPGRQ